ncbi:MAG: PIN domain-containing protein [Gemmatimonadota bacterium]
MSSRARFRTLLQDAGRVHIDARVLALHVAASARHVDLTRQLFAGLRAGEFNAQTSSMSIFQIVVEPFRRGDEETAGQAERWLSALPGLEVLPVTAAVARQAAQVKAQLGGRTERAVQLATALEGGARLFLTDRSSIRRIAGMQLEALEAFLPRA